ncbi:hypothetical protein [Pseudomonas umsongensis]|uniref:hypothetical protein n=1 Tax=Pseudomonas umsongensis TaxID=198618 RepID=UPI003ECEE6C0
MAVTPLPVLDRTSATFKTDTDTFFGTQLPTFSVEVNQVASAADSSATAANASKVAAAASEAAALASKNAAKTSETNAKSSETNAGTYFSAALSSKNAAATSAANAATSAATALTQADRAQAAADGIASGPVTSVNGKTGTVTISKAEMGLGNVDNTSDANKPVSSAQLAAMHAMALLF